jgi:hypothetical protein
MDRDGLRDRLDAASVRDKVAGPGRSWRYLEVVDETGSTNADLTGRQPGLDADRVSPYRHHRCLQALQRGTPQARQDLSGVPRTHQYVVTPTVHTNTSNPTIGRPAHRQPH